MDEDRVGDTDVYLKMC